MMDKERIIPGIILIIIALGVGFDLITDRAQGAALWHILTELFIAIIALVSAIWLFIRALSFKRQLKNARHEIEIQKDEAALWRAKAKTHIDGLSQEISRQMLEWGLSPSEKEIAFLLIKGLSMREIAEIRQTNEKTARAQASVIYQKSRLNGRADLAAYFLEDLLSAGNIEKIDTKS